MRFIRENKQSFFRFCIVGLINTLVDLTVFISLYYYISLDVIPSHIMSFAIASAGSYILNKYWSFSDKKAMSVIEIVKFSLVLLSCLLLTSAFLKFFVTMYGMAFLGKVLAIGISMAWNYIGMRLFVFKVQSSNIDQTS